MTQVDGCGVRIATRQREAEVDRSDSACFLGAMAERSAAMLAVNMPVPGCAGLGHGTQPEDPRASSRYRAYSMARTSRSTVTLISPG